jgi:hypothetical protein
MRHISGNTQRHRLIALPRRQSAPRGRRELRPAAAFRQRVTREPAGGEEFAAPERWHPPRGLGNTRIAVEPPGEGFRHVLAPAEIVARLARLPAELTRRLEVVQLSRATRKRRLFPCYGMQWGCAIYLYPIEESLIEVYDRPPTMAQRVEARMFGGTWRAEQGHWKLIWTPASIRDFYLNNVLIHELGHICDTRNSNPRDRERFANWFAVEYGYRASRGLSLLNG